LLTMLFCATYMYENQHDFPIVFPLCTLLLICNSLDGMRPADLH
jgi:hypothetical protein